MRLHRQTAVFLTAPAATMGCDQAVACRYNPAMQISRGPALLLSLWLLGACAGGPQRPAPPAIDRTAAFSAEFPGSPAEPETAGWWWRTAVSGEVWPRLEQALSANPEMQAAYAQIAAAEARLIQAEADTGAELGLAAEARAVKDGGDTSNRRSIGVDGRLPLDVSGALADRVEAARAQLVASVADADRLRSDLARDFLFALIDSAEAAQRVALLDRQIEVSKTLLRLTELRFTQGLTSSVDVLQQRDELAALRQQIPFALLEGKIAANALRRIAALTPDRPAPLLLETLPPIKGDFPRIQPLDLLHRRASLRASQARIEAADARFAAALADRWPSVALSSEVVTRAMSGDVSTLIAAAIDATLTLFDGDRKVAIAEERRAQLVAAGEQYLTDWFEAVIEVDDLMHTEASLQERIVLSEQRLRTVDTLLTAARRRYERGVSDYLPVLAALRGQQQQQRDHLALQAALARSRVRLHRALG
jgi:outer membrane protein TolC